MAGGKVKYRYLSRNAPQRKALLRGLVTQLVQYEHIQTSYAKAKEAQRMAEKLITYAKRNNEPARRSAQAMLYTPHDLLPKVFGELRDRYLERPGGYTRVMRTETKDQYGQSESAILELVDGPKDSRFMTTAKALARDRELGRTSRPLTERNITKVTQFRGQADLEQMVDRFRMMSSEPRPGEEEEDESSEALELAEREQHAADDFASELASSRRKR